MATSKDYKLGPATFPRGWFIVAEASELDDGPIPVHYFGEDFVLYRGESGRIVMLDAYCAHMGSHLASDSAVIVREKRQLEGDSIRCPYHGWRYGPEGALEDIPGMDECPEITPLRSHPVREVMGCAMAWYDPDGNPPAFEPPFLKEWDDPAWVHWQLDHVGVLNVHGQEILDNMADASHLGPTHGAPCEEFENEFRDHIYIQRQGGFHEDYQAQLDTVTWYTGPGILLSKQRFGPMLTFELIANTPVDDGVTQVWHACLTRAEGDEVLPADIERARAVQATALKVFGADFDIWKHKRPALRPMQMPVDGPFFKGRKWLSQFYAEPAKVVEIQQSVNGRHHVQMLPEPGDGIRSLEAGLFG